MLAFALMGTVVSTLCVELAMIFQRVVRGVKIISTPMFDLVAAARTKRQGHKCSWLLHLNTEPMILTPKTVGAVYMSAVSHPGG